MAWIMVPTADREARRDDMWPLRWRRGRCASTRGDIARRWGWGVRIRPDTQDVALRTQGDAGDARGQAIHSDTGARASWSGW